MHIGGVLFVLLLYFTLNCLYTGAVSEQVKNPNIVLIAVNKLGISDLNAYWEYLKNIKRLSENGFRFGHVYSQLYPTSSRAALLTGRLPVKTGMLKGRFLPFTSLPSIASSGGLPLSEQTLAEKLKRKGYANKFIGLWDQGLGRDGKFLPLNQGFDSWFGITTQHSEACSSLQQIPHKDEALTIMLYAAFWSLFVVVSLWCLHFLKAKVISTLIILGIILYACNSRTKYIAVRSCVLYRDHYIIAQPYNIENITLRFTDEALGFIKSTAEKHPFFVMVNHLALSRPLFTSLFFQNFSGKSDAILDSLVELDWNVGSIMSTIDHLNLTDNTIFIFTALSGDWNCNDKMACNGSIPSNYSSPSNWERQIQVPMYIKLPNTLGKSINQTVTLMDIMPTVLELTNTSYSKELLDGKSLLGLLNGTSESLHSYVFHYLDVTRPSAITSNVYKVFYTTGTVSGFVNHDPPLLFNIKKDPQETAPLAVEDYHDVIANISEAQEKHVENKTRKWLSQFEHPIFPWLFPCAHFPYCHRRDISKLKHITFKNSS